MDYRDQRATVLDTLDSILQAVGKLRQSLEVEWQYIDEDSPRAEALREIDLMLWDTIDPYKEEI